ncbi:MAG: hypothetical protein ABIG90_00295 [bacterium]
MNFKALQNKTKNLLIFNKNSLRKLEPQKDALDANIKYWLKNKKIIALKKSLYVLTEKYQKESNKDLFIEYIANQLVRPSYLSTEYILAKYQILTESVNAITSVTAKINREIINTITSFRYSSISPKLFTGFKIKYFNSAPILEAEKSKALFDFLYFRFLKNAKISKMAIKNLRLNWENISTKEFKKVCSYLKFTSSQKIKQLFKLIEQEYYA